MASVVDYAVPENHEHTNTDTPTHLAHIPAAAEMSSTHFVSLVTSEMHKIYNQIKIKSHQPLRQAFQKHSIPPIDSNNIYT